MQVRWDLEAMQVRWDLDWDLEAMRVSRDLKVVQANRCTETSGAWDGQKAARELSLRRLGPRVGAPPQGR
jgi:hypothetical protein